MRTAKGKSSSDIALNFNSYSVPVLQYLKLSFVLSQSEAMTSFWHGYFLETQTLGEYIFETTNGGRVGVLRRLNIPPWTRDQFDFRMHRLVSQLMGISNSLVFTEMRRHDDTQIHSRFSISYSLRGGLRPGADIVSHMLVINTGKSGS